MARTVDRGAVLLSVTRIALPQKNQEECEISHLQVQDGQLRWQIPSQDFGSSQVMLENQEARRLSDLLESWPKVTIRDAAWIERVVSDLKSERPVPAEGVHKNARRKG